MFKHGLWFGLERERDPFFFLSDRNRVYEYKNARTGGELRSYIDKLQGDVQDGGRERS